MAKITEETIVELERLEREATPAPWVGRVETHESTRFRSSVCFAQIRAGSIAVLKSDESNDSDPRWQSILNDLRMVERLRNAAPQLLEAARRSLAYEAFLREHGKASYECLLSRALGCSAADDASSAHSAAAKLHTLLERLPK